MVVSQLSHDAIAVVVASGVVDLGLVVCQAAPLESGAERARLVVLVVLLLGKLQEDLRMRHGGGVTGNSRKYLLEIYLSR